MLIIPQLKISVFDEYRPIALLNVKTGIGVIGVCYRIGVSWVIKKPKAVYIMTLCI